MSGIAGDLAAHVELLERLVSTMDERIAAMPPDRDSVPLGPDLQVLLVVLEEYAGLRAADLVDKKTGARVRALVARLLSEGRKAGVRVLIVVQRADASVVDGLVRAQCALRVSFSVDSGEAVRMLHPGAPDVADVLAAPPGVALLTMPGAPLTRFRAPLLGYPGTSSSSPAPPHDPRSAARAAHGRPQPLLPGRVGPLCVAEVVGRVKGHPHRHHAAATRSARPAVLDAPGVLGDPSEAGVSGEEGRPSHHPGSEDAPRAGAAGGTTARLASSPRSPQKARGRHGAKTGVSCRARGAGGAAAPAARPALGNSASTSSAGAATAPAEGEDRALTARLRRAERWSLLNRLRPVTSLCRVRDCRRATLTGTGGPVLRVDGQRGAGYAGLATCGSVWACPCCAAKIASRRAAELADVLTAVHRACGSAYMLTLTMRHHRGQRLATLWDAVSAARGSVTSGRAWVDDTAGMLGWARVVEVTHSPRSGWHVRVHALLT